MLVLRVGGVEENTIDLEVIVVHTRVLTGISVVRKISLNWQEMLEIPKEEKSDPHSNRYFIEMLVVWKKEKKY